MKKNPKEDEWHRLQRTVEFQRRKLYEQWCLALALIRLYESARANYRAAVMGAGDRAQCFLCEDPRGEAKLLSSFAGVVGTIRDQLVDAAKWYAHWFMGAKIVGEDKAREILLEQHRDAMSPSTREAWRMFMLLVHNSVVQCHDKAMDQVYWESQRAPTIRENPPCQ